MPPKKKGGKSPQKGKKGPKKDDAPGEMELTPEEKYERAVLKIESLERELVARNEQMLRAVAAQNELRQRVLEYHRDFEAEKQNTLEITADMTRQYKAMQETLMAKNNQLEAKIAELTDQLELSKVALDELKREKDGIIVQKEKKIAEQRQKMEEMAMEFGDMLKEILDKMSQRIEITRSNWEQASQRIEEFARDAAS
eukprot:tig00000704_g3330.t1